jgi:hypothetical protein
MQDCLQTTKLPLRRIADRCREISEETLTTFETLTSRIIHLPCPISDWILEPGSRLVNNAVEFVTFKFESAGSCSIWYLECAWTSLVKNLTKRRS